MTGHDHRDLQCTIVATIAGIVEQDFVHAICALINFIYQAQSPTFTELSICNMEGSLSEFHKYKGKSKEIDHFWIPKLELLQSFGCTICNVGSLIQYMVDDLFSRTNHQHAEFTQQIMLLLDREESIRQFNLYALLYEKRLSLTNTLPAEYNGPKYIDPTLDWIQCVSLADMNCFHGPRTLSNYVATTYHLPDFTTLLQVYIATIRGDSSHFNGHLLKGWLKFRIQL
ncbi:hypothetical protein J3A83DRAFT_4266869 [Scleroderma citrinum]